MLEFPFKSAAMLASWLAVAGSALSAEPYVVYDGFGVATLDATKWSTSERFRGIKAGMLNMVQRDWGAVGSDVGSFGLSWGEDLAAQGKVTQIRARIIVNAIDMSSCAANPAVTSVRARTVGTFFNTGNPTPGSFVGDVIVQARMARFSNSVDPTGVMQVQGRADMCTNADCSASSPIGAVSLGTATVGTMAELSIEWNKAAKKFVFIRDAGASIGEVPYTVSDAAGPGRPVQAIGTRIDLPFCASGPRTMGFVDASFDNVSVNRTAKP